jgi:hypothetical protein
MPRTIAPPNCRTCGHIITVTAWTRGRNEPEQTRNDTCDHPTGAKPMHDPCAWKVEKREGATNAS